MNIKLLAATVAALFVTPAAAQAQNIAIEANGARAQERWGAELGVGYNFRAGPITVRPIGGVLVYPGENDRYYNDTFSNGETRCRDSQNGQFARDSLCDNTAASLYGKVEATATIPLIAEIGAGARFSSDRTRIYGTAAFAILPAFKVKANVGDRYYALGLLASF